ncbi:MAG TPA: hypothetical protein VKZ59_06055, partial [Acidobacteriota bacterium]|nr:hypothetical protein [Acidobacteriota bacterium]
MRQHIFFLGIAVVVFLTAFQDVLLHRQGTLVRGFDASVQTFPWMVYLARHWQNLTPPLWDFTSFSGTSFAGELQTGVFYPPNILLGILFGDSLSPYTLDWYIFFHYVFAFYFMALFLSSSGFGRLAAVFGGFAFAAYLDWAQPNRLVGMIYLPLILYSYQKTLESKPRNRILYTLLAAASLSLALLGGHTQPFLHSSIALALLAFFYALTAPGWGRAFGQLFWIVSAAVLITAPQWLLTVEYVSHSYRWAPERTPGFSSVPYEIYGFVSTLSPELLNYLLWSWIPLAVLGGVAFLFFLRSENSARRLLLLYALVLGTFAFLASLGDAGLIAKVTWHISILNTVRQAERYVFLILFSSAVILAVDLSILSDRVATALRSLDRPGHRRILLFGAVGMLGLLGIWIGTHASAFLRIQPDNDPLTPALRYREESVIRF